MADKKAKEAKIVTKKSVSELRADLLAAKSSLHNGTLTNSHAINVIRKDIARALTTENITRKETKGKAND